MQKRSILLIGYDSNLFLGVIYCLRSLNCSLYLLTSNKKNAAKYSRYAKKTFLYDKFNEDAALNTVINIVKQHHIDLIMPIDELETRFIHQHRAQLSNYAPCTWATDTEMFDIGINKARLAAFLASNGLPCPVSATAGNIAELETAANTMGYPVLIKPTRSSFGRGIQKFESWDALKSFYEEAKPGNNDFILQPFIIGSDITCNVICKDGKILCHTIQESPVKTGSNFSSNDILDFHDDDGVVDVVGKMMALLKWSGVACVDMRRDSRDGSVNILEINGRFWASVVVSYLKAGVNFPLIMAKLAWGEEVTIPQQKPARQISFKDYLRSVFSAKKASFKDTKYISYVADPLARFFQVTKL
jgi:predicted ATP-grasp superfamily ATP-dependent carboligase